MGALLPLFRILPPLLVFYGTLLTFANIVALRNTASIGGGIDASILTELRITYLTGLVQTFDGMFYYFALAALVTAANRYLEKEFG
ncbi:MAG: hypothetical protein B7Z02_03945 [Rhodobacterales bacterium 32-67-9]|nr:MAG: hypothetical protein B7Z02_03945 [Rhodobacterales bacterium 32-67-9]